MTGFQVQKDKNPFVSLRSIQFIYKAFEYWYEL